MNQTVSFNAFKGLQETVNTLLYAALEGWLSGRKHRS